MIVKDSKKKKRYTRESDIREIEQDENFYFIAGYTDGGFPFRIT
jgi:hypothetical protein